MSKLELRITIEQLEVKNAEYGIELTLNQDLLKDILETPEKERSSEQIIMAALIDQLPQLPVLKTLFLKEADITMPNGGHRQFRRDL